ncbi:MAG: hypothetical protein ABH950_05055 [Candidatus Altiarchaeota archaeon]
MKTIRLTILLLYALLFFSTFVVGDMVGRNTLFNITVLHEGEPLKEMARVCLHDSSVYAQSLDKEKNKQCADCPMGKCSIKTGVYYLPYYTEEIEVWYPVGSDDGSSGKYVHDEDIRMWRNSYPRGRKTSSTEIYFYTSINLDLKKDGSMNIDTQAINNRFSDFTEIPWSTVLFYLGATLLVEGLALIFYLRRHSTIRVLKTVLIFFTANTFSLIIGWVVYAPLQDFILFNIFKVDYMLPGPIIFNEYLHLFILSFGLVEVAVVLVEGWAYHQFNKQDFSLKQAFKLSVLTNIASASVFLILILPIVPVIMRFFF